MTEPLDLDALRARLINGAPMLDVFDTVAAELRACRAERDEYRHDSYRCAHLTRAERAEAERDALSVQMDSDIGLIEDLAEGWQRRAERAEAALARMSVRCRAGNWVCGTCGTELRGDDD